MSTDASPDTPVDPQGVTRCASQIWPAWAPTWIACGSPVGPDGRCERHGHEGVGPLRGEASGTPIDPDVLTVLEYVSAGRGYVDVEPYPDAIARRALGRLRPPVRQP